jgi:hypothetical protein
MAFKPTNTRRRRRNTVLEGRASFPFWEGNAKLVVVVVIIVVVVVVEYVTAYDNKYYTREI